MAKVNTLRANKLEIRKQYLAGVPVVKLAEKYNVTPTSLSTFISRHKLATTDDFMPPTYTEVMQQALDRMSRELAKTLPFKAYRFVADYRVDNDGVAGIVLIYDESRIGGLEMRRAISKLNAKQSMSIFILNEEQAKLFSDEFYQENKIDLTQEK